MPLFCSAENFLSLYRDIQDRTGTLRLQAKGGSMFPFIRSGDWVGISPCRGTTAVLMKGDIILFTIAKKLYMHRVVRLAGDSVITKGDQAVGYDGVIGRADILGKVVSVEHSGRRIDLESPPSRVLSVMMADASGVLQYLFLAARKAVSVGVSILSFMQRFRLYRSLAKNCRMSDIRQIRIREACPDDDEEIRDLLLMGGHDVRKDIASVKREGFWLVAAAADRRTRGRGKERIVGSMTVTRFEGDSKLWVLFGLEVKPHLRGLGIGERLVREAIAKAAGGGGCRVGLFVNKRAGPALVLYRKLGFSASDDFPPDFNRSADELWLSRKVDEEHSVFASPEQLVPGGGSEGRSNDMMPQKWNKAFFDALVREGMFYPFYRDLIAPSGDGEEAIPADQCERFRQAYYEHISKGADTVRAFERILTALDTLDIPVLVFKGPAIDFLIYDGFARPRLDLDIAVRDADMPLLEKGLAGLGYARPPVTRECLIPEYLNSAVFMPKEAGGVVVHVHRNIVNNMFLTVDGAFVPDMEHVWRETEPFKQYRHIVTLQPEIAIVYLCEHALKHDIDQLVFLYEIDRLVQYYQGRFDWGKVVLLTKELGLDRIVYHVLACMVSGAIPDPVLEALRPKRITSGEKRFVRAVLQRKQKRYSSYAVYLALRKGAPQKARFIRLTVFPPGFTLRGCLRRLCRFTLR